MSPRRVDVAVVGAGPAGVAAACRAAEAGRSVALLDEAPGAGGQIWRHAPGGPAPAEARRWLERLSRSGAAHHPRTSVFDLARAGDGFRVAAATGAAGERLDLLAGRLVLCTGARELLLPFAGWTLPGVAGAGGLQALVKGGMGVRGRRVVLAGSGPLLLAVAEVLAAEGAEVLAVAEQAGAGALAGLGLRLLASPGKLAQAIRFGASLGARYRTGWWLSRAEGQGRDRLQAAVLTDGRREERLPCDLLGASFGLVPQTEAARLLGARLAGPAAAPAAAVGERQEASLTGLFAAGEVCGVAGADVALAEGQLAGLAAAGLPPEPALLEARRAGRAAARAMERAFALRPEVLRAPPPDTVVCRCEDVREGDLDPAVGPREAKLQTRLGMGPCQGRVCGAALARLHGWEPLAPRSPLFPVPLSTLVPEDEP